MNPITPLATAGLLANALFAQELLWQFPSPPSADILLEMAPFVDYDGDGYRDFLHRREIDYAQPNWTFGAQIRSGRDGSVLWEHRNQSNALMTYAGDVNGDGSPDIAIVQGWSWTTSRLLEMWSPATSSVLWTQGSMGDLYGYSMVGDFDVDGDGRSEFAALGMGTSGGVYVYNSNGTLRYSLPAQAYSGVAISVGKLADIDGDSHDDLLVGINDTSFRGTVLVVSGHSGTVLRQHHGQLVGDKTCDFVRSMGDLDGDGVPEYAAFPWITAGRSIVLVWSGATGNLFRTYQEFANSVITGEDFDRDDVPDMAIGADWTVGSNLYGSTHVYSGRDGARLWQVDNVPVVPWGNGGPGFYGWMEHSASLGFQPGDAYPTIAWLDVDWWAVGTVRGRVRAFRTNYAGQSIVRGSACASSGRAPLIGVRRRPSAVSAENRARVTVARGPVGASAWLLVGFANQTTYAGLLLPIPLATVGLPGCALQVAPIITPFTTLGAAGIDAGYGFVDLNHSLSSTVTGTRVAAQWLLLDPANIQYGMSEVHELSLR